MASMVDESESFQDVDGKPIVNGYIYIGSDGQNPALNPISIYSDRSLTAPLSNPQRTNIYGRTVNKIWIEGRYSLKVEDSDNVQKYQDLSRGELPSTVTTNLINIQGINDITADASPAISAYIDKAVYIFTSISANTGAVTLSFGGGIKDITDSDGAALSAAYYTAGSILQVIFNAVADRFEMITYSSSAVTTALAAIDVTLALKSDRNIGELIDFTGTTAPPNFLACPTSQTNISRTTYSKLFTAISTTWGIGDGSTTFGMPWFAAGYVAVQSNADVGVARVGQNLAHTHTVATGAGTGSGDLQYNAAYRGYLLQTTSSSGGSANLAAGVAVLKCVRYQ